MYKDMEEWLRIRQRVINEGVSKRQVLRETGMPWKPLVTPGRTGRGPGILRSSRTS